MRGKSIFYRLTLIFCKSDKSNNFFYTFQFSIHFQRLRKFYTLYSLCLFTFTVNFFFPIFSISWLYHFWIIKTQMWNPQSDATTSSSKMKPVKWVKWSPPSYNHAPDDMLVISTQTRSPFFKFIVDWRVDNGLLWPLTVFASSALPVPILTPFK